MENLTTLAIVLLIVLFVCYNFPRWRLYRLSWEIPGPVALPLIGNGLLFLCKPKDILKVIREKLLRKYDSIFRIWLGPQLFIVVQDAEHIQAVTMSQKLSTKHDIYRFMEPFLGKGLFTSHGNTHRNHRNLLQPFFSPKMLEGYSHLFHRYATKFVDGLEEYAHGSVEFDVLPLLHESMYEASVDIFLEDTGHHSYDAKELSSYIRRFYAVFYKRVYSVWLHPDWLFRFSSLYREQQQMSIVANGLTKEIYESRVPAVVEKLDKKKAALASLGEAFCEDRTPSMLETMIELICENPASLSEQECVDHLHTFVATSQDTSSSAICFTLMMLGMHRNVQEMVVDELRDVLGGKKTAVDFNDVTQLNYMEMCIKEAMRLFPVGPFLGRKTSEPFQLENWVIPTGTAVVIGTFPLHRSKKYWEKPEEFYPEHFSKENVQKRHPYAYIPFSAGPRRCIAQHYSYTSMKIIIANFLRKFVVKSDYEKVSDIQLAIDISIRPLDGYRIKIENRRNF